MNKNQNKWGWSRSDAAADFFEIAIGCLLIPFALIFGERSGITLAQGFYIILFAIVIAAACLSGG